MSFAMLTSPAVLARKPRLNIVFRGRGIAEISRTDVKNVIWDLQCLHQFFFHLEQKLMLFARVLRPRNGEHFQFIKLVYAQDAFCILSIRTRFAPETC